MRNACVQVAAKLFEHLRLFVTENSYLMQFYKINICQIMIFMQFYEINICQILIFRLCIAFNKHKMTKNSNESREKSQVLSQVLE